VKVHYRVRGSDPFWPRAMRRRPVMAWRSVSRGMYRRSIELRNHRLGVPTTSNGGEGNMDWCDRASASPAPRSQRPAACAYAPCAEAGRARKMTGGEFRCQSVWGRPEAVIPACTLPSSRTGP